MSTYFVKQKNRLFRFGSFRDLENYLGREINNNFSLAHLIKTNFPGCAFRSKSGALLEGWIDMRGEAVPSLMKGNYWRPRSWKV